VPLVAPWIRTECDTCDWRNVCIAQLTTADDPTLLRGVDATTRDALADQGVLTVTEVADLDPTDPGVPRSDVVFQARARVHGGLLSAGGDGDPMDLPSSRVEVDLDLETHAGSVYLAGLMTTVEGVSTYEAITDWSNTTRGERRLVTELFARLVALGRQDAIVFHWTDYEVRTLATLAERHDVTIEDHVSVEAWFAKHACDLCEWSRQHLASPAGYSLKVVAPLCDFSWRDVDPGGLQSEIWFEDLLAGDATMRRRLLEYNEDDVRAQLAVRSWVRRHDDGSGPGSTIPSVLVWPVGG
jgi:predicted RecB family nuclease